MASKLGNEEAKDLLSKMKNIPDYEEEKASNTNNTNYTKNVVLQNKNISRNKRKRKNKNAKNKPNNQVNWLLIDTLKLHKKSMEYRQALIDHEEPKMTMDQNRINERKVIKNFTELAEKGESVAMLNLGIYYENGYTVVQDQEEALKLYKQSKELGNKEANERYERLFSKMKNTQG